MSGATLSIKLDEFKPEPSPGPSFTAPAVQTRKSDRACDFCRRRKTRCDGAPTPNSKCTNCRRNQCPCTFLEASRPRGPPKAYVTALEDRIERFERLFKRLRPEANFTNVLGPPIPRGSWKNDRDSDSTSGPSNSPEVARRSSSQRSSSRHPAYIPSNPSILLRHAREQISPSEDDSSSDGDFSLSEWPPSRLPAQRGSHLKAAPAEDPLMQEYLSVNEEGSSIRFHGKSSFFPLVQVARHYMRANAREDGSQDPGKGREASLSDNCRIGLCNIPKRRLDIYWTLPPWEEAWQNNHSAYGSSSASSSSSSYSRTSKLHTFPPPDLTLPLISLFFQHTNLLFPLLHAPTFNAQFHDGLHLRDAQFAGIVWCLMAIGARWSQDPRVLWDGWGAEPGSTGQPESGTASDRNVEWASAGWRFFLRSLDGPSFTVTSHDPPSLFDLQFCSLGAMFLRGSSIHPAGWVMIGTGLRKAMDVGAHRKRVYGSKPSVDNELWKRAFWMLVLFDRIGSGSLGRPCCVREEDFDLDLPLEVDDDYWIPNDPYQAAFTQPTGKPSVVTGFVSLLKLTQIMAQALRTIYCIDKSKVLLGLVSDDWQEQIVSQLNTALDEWVESVPEHLRWASDIENDIFANQSATIYSTYYLVLILIYRPFSQASVYLPQQDVPAKPNKLFPFPADSICTNAAHSAIRIIDVQTRRGMSNIPNMISVAQLCAVTQFMGLHVLQASREGDPRTNARERERIMQDIEKCIDCLKLVESRWIMARKFIQSFSDSLPSQSDSHDFKGKEEFNYSDGPLASGIPSIYVQPSASGGSSQSWSNSFDVRSPSRMSDSEQALTNRANWRWFYENPTFAQQRISKRHVGDPLRHHVPQLVPSSNPYETHSITPGMADGFARRAEIDPREFSQSRSAPPLPPVVSGQPISSRSRKGHALASGQALSVAPPQSAVRDEQVGGWNRQAAAVRVPQHPYAALHQTPRQVYRPSAEKHIPGRGNAGFVRDGHNNSMR